MVDPSYKGKQYPPYEFTIERGKLREFLLAIDEQNPAYQSEDAPVPPTFPTVFTFWGGANLEARLGEMGVDMVNVLHGEQEYEYFAPIRVGDTVTGQTRINDIYERKGSSGSMQFIEFITEYSNQSGALVLIDRALIIVRG